jgi:hypothetical protein
VTGRVKGIFPFRVLRNHKDILCVAAFDVPLVKLLSLQSIEQSAF